MKKILFGLIAIVAMSFTVNAQDLRANFLKGKDYNQITADFNKLSISEKNALWVEKMDQLLAQKLPKDHQLQTSTIREIILKNMDVDNASKMIEISINLANITPEDDFLKMYGSLYDYNYQGKFLGADKVSEFILEDLRKLGTSSTASSGETANKDCNCRWTCDLWNRNAPTNDKEPATGSSASKCHITADGCGFLWMSECTGYIGL